MSITVFNQDQLVLKGKVALLSGANGGIGLAVCATYLANGSSCMVLDLADSPSAELSELIKQYPDSLSYCPTNVTDLDQIEQAISKTKAQYGHIDVLFNNAAIFDMGPILESTSEQFDRLYNVNVKGMFFMMQAVAKEMVAAGKGGKIINMASQAGRRGEPLVAHYCATKAAVISYTQSAGLALADNGINVNSISPGVVDTPMWDQVDALFAKYENRQPGEKKRLVGEEVPLGRMGLPDDMAGMALFLASPMSDYITAQTFNVDGGNAMN
ncbi:sorbitol dehydrogenase [Vibrio nigripulchritudo ATCC 27043]|uniref:L-iditol 2-dehydrogenase n=1 Tax=Vibrio nigripulchritudo TaxID=28173 RepID=UPI00021C3B08|nr:L-iditol 2-dehydrogenase [Vibrio nigripulchritudo]EGU60175.1 sorbitol dehydrogenase [Vibrio nigripulchritudo ATCC 27043]